MTELVIPGLLLTAVGVLLFFRLEVRRQRALAAVATLVGIAVFTYGSAGPVSNFLKHGL